MKVDGSTQITRVSFGVGAKNNEPVDRLILDHGQRAFMERTDTVAPRASSTADSPRVAMAGADTFDPLKD
jgi:hypothetical protein